MKKSKFLLIRILWITLGSTFVAIGTISSEKLYNWLIRNKTFGKYIKDYREGKGMPMRAKIFAQSMMTIFIFLAVFPLSPISVPSLWLKVLVFSLGLVGFWYVGFRVPTREA